MSKIIDAVSLLTAKQLAQLNAFNDSTNSERDLAAMRATGQVGKTMRNIQIEVKVEELFKQFQKSNYTNVSMFARYFSWISGAWLDTGKLPVCPNTMQGFLQYEETLHSWVYATESEKTQKIRYPKMLEIVSIIDRVKMMVNDAKQAKPATPDSEVKPAKQAKQLA
jgi:hypothetical protein